MKKNLLTYLCSSPSNEISVSHIRRTTKGLKIALIAFFTLSFFLTHAQWQTNGANIYYLNGNIGVGIQAPVDQAHINAVGGGILRMSNQQSSYLTSQEVIMGTLRGIGTQWNASYSATNSNETSALRLTYYADVNGRINNAAIRFYTQDDGSGPTKERLSIVGPNIGIGTSSPESVLDVYSPTNSVLKVRNESYTDGYSEVRVETKRFGGLPGNTAGLITNASGAAINGIPSGTSGIYSRWRPFVFAVGDGSGNTFEYMRISQFGGVAIGLADPGSYKLNVWGKVRAHELVINTTGADFVFEKDYSLTPLEQVASYIEEHKHLSEIPPAAEMQTNGMQVGELQTKLLQKIEELTLYLIDQNRKIAELEKTVKALKK